MNDIGKEFMKKTRYKFLEKSDQKKGIEQPPLVLDYDRSKDLITLPDPEELQPGDINLRKVVEERRTIRKYSKEPLSLQELSYLLWITQGVKEVVKENLTLRTVPSAGARHAFETYLLINKVSGLKPGLYRFLAIEHKLLEVNSDPDLADEMSRACLRQKTIKTSAVSFIWAAVAERMKWRYGERSYRYLHLDAGHVCQNLYLGAELIDCGVCAIGAFSDEDVNELLKFDGENEFVIYIGTIGKKLKR